MEFCGYQYSAADANFKKLSPIFFKFVVILIFIFSICNGEIIYRLRDSFFNKLLNAISKRNLILLSESNVDFQKYWKYGLRNEINIYLRLSPYISHPKNII